MEEANILEFLRTKYAEDRIYVSNEYNSVEYLKKNWTHHTISQVRASDVLIALNPYKNIPELYGIKAEYSHQVPPHCYEIGKHRGVWNYFFSIIFTYIKSRVILSSAYRALQMLKIKRKPQTILVSGLTGAGKTQTTNYVMQFLCGSTAASVPISEFILASNPILESFGNAATDGNSNSSRFCRFIKVRHIQIFPAILCAIVN